MKVYLCLQRFFCTPLKQYIPVGAMFGRYENTCRLVVQNVPSSGNDMFNTLVNGVDYDDPKYVTWFYGVEGNTELFSLYATIAEDQYGTASMVGTQGIQGSSGIQGLMGTQGLSGSVVGLQGLQGVAGTGSGDSGTQGNQGFQGALGGLGSQGNQGLLGGAGVQGNVGATGIQGNVGITGVQGNQGIGGLGTQGSQGILGSGTQGNQGVAGASESGGGGSANDNFIDNPNFAVSLVHGSSIIQAVTSGDGAAGVHIVDRWRVNQVSGGFSWIVSRNTGDNPTGSTSKYTLKLTSNSAGGGATLIQRFSSDQVRKFRGGACTLGFWYKPAISTTTCAINIKTPAADTDFTTVTTRNESGSGYSVTGLIADTWNYVSYQFNPSSWTNIANGMQLDVVIPVNPSVPASFADFRLASGAIASATMSAGFVPPTVAENEARCGVYVNKTFPRDTAVSQNGGFTGAILYRCVLTTASGHHANWRFPYRMRTTPNVTCYSPDNASSDWSPGGGGYVTSSIGYISESGVTVTSGAATTSVGTGYYLHLMAECRL